MMGNKIKCTGCGKRLNNSVTMCPKCHGAVKLVAQPNDKSAERKSTIWAYVTGLLFILTGLGAFQIGLLPAVTLTLGGILVLPFIRAALVRMSGFATDKPFIILSTILIICGAISYVYTVKGDRLERIESEVASE